MYYQIGFVFFLLPSFFCTTPRADKPGAQRPITRSSNMTSNGAYVPPHKRGFRPTSETSASTLSNPPLSIRTFPQPDSSRSFRKRPSDPYANFPVAFSGAFRRNNRNGEKTYTIRQIQERVPGASSHTFVQAAPPLRDTDEHEHPRASVDPSVQDPPWYQKICRIMVHLDAHPAGPEELWTRHSFPLLEASMTSELKIPLFVQLPNQRWEFKGRSEIALYEIFEGGSEEVRGFVEKRKESEKLKWVETWKDLLGMDWARVELSLAEDQSLGNPMEGI
ncbi:hypothetical protein DACRYDRAFT_116489 [Dacryopinax primogenitus]|uniref:Uncharacterized protein n=1 Tax=Dacryopinax primogenitus (strain DJM 731) TaxID=1858805 RepID=M5GBC8_DACPD|nr:uncharacterized protein DACRYDRAFT_116489 [Dacryopinax primogenitus]EJU01298.1 hypothetical protein DACRYDRAFT_116489 [Dacryopinax primogenitus]